HAGEFTDVRTGNERLFTGTGYHDYANLVVFFELIKRRKNVITSRNIHHIELVWTIDGDHCNSATLLYQHIFNCHMPPATALPLIESVPCLPPQLSLCYFQSENFRSAEQRRYEVLVEIVGNARDDIEAYKVGQAERNHRVVVAEPHGLVDVFCPCHYPFI